MVIEMSIAATGALESSDIYRARFVNQAKLAYSAWRHGSTAMRRCRPR